MADNRMFLACNLCCPRGKAGHAATVGSWVSLGKWMWEGWYRSTAAGDLNIELAQFYDRHEHEPDDEASGMMGAYFRLEYDTEGRCPPDDTPAV